MKRLHSTDSYRHAKTRLILIRISTRLCSDHVLSSSQQHVLCCPLFGPCPFFLTTALAVLSSVRTMSFLPHNSTCCAVLCSDHVLSSSQQHLLCCALFGPCPLSLTTALAVLFSVRTMSFLPHNSTCCAVLCSDHVLSSSQQHLLCCPLFGPCPLSLTPALAVLSSVRTMSFLPHNST